MKQSITAFLGGPILLLIGLLFFNSTLSLAQGPTPSTDLDHSPYLSSCKNADQETQKACSNKNLLTYVGENLTYPKEAYKEKAEGLVILEFVVGKDGKIKKGKVLKSSQYTVLDKAALALLDKMKTDQTWSPGIKDGKAVSASLKLPVKFKLK